MAADKDIDVLVKQAKSGDDLALSKLIKQMLPIVNHICHNASCPWLDFDDAAQEGLIGLLNAALTFEESQNVKFETYATRCIQNAVYSAIKKASRKKHAPLNNSVPLTCENIIQGPEDIAIENEQYYLTVQNINSRLSGFEKDVLLLFLDGLSYEQIADKLNKPIKAVDNALARVRRKLKM